MRTEPLPRFAVLEAPAALHSATWPLTIALHALVGVEPHDRGNPVAFGFGAELLWRAQVGGFVALLASEGTPVIPPRRADDQAQPGFGDRISVPFGFAARPFSVFAVRSHGYWSRLLGGIGVQLGPTLEYVRTSDDSAITAGLHAALAIDVPLYGGPAQGGVALRLYGRLMFTPEVTLDNRTVLEPVASGQVYAGICYYP